MKRIYTLWMCVLLLAGLSACTDEYAVKTDKRVWQRER